MTNQVSASNEIYLRARSQKTFDAHDLSLMRAQCVRTLALGKVHFSLSQSSTFAIRRQSTRHVRWPPWLARSYASVSTPTQPHKDRPPSVDYSTQHKQKAVARSEIHTPTSLQKELRYLGDPRKLADHVLHLLQEGGGDKAYELIKMGSRKLPCTVSWNHLIDFEMSQGRVANACSIFNDVWVLRSEMIPITNIPRDEEASSKARCPDIYPPFPWVGQVRSLPTISRPYPLNLPVDVCR